MHKQFKAVPPNPLRLVSHSQVQSLCVTTLYRYLFFQPPLFESPSSKLGPRRIVTVESLSRRTKYRDVCGTKSRLFVYQIPLHLVSVRVFNYNDILPFSIPSKQP